MGICSDLPASQTCPKNNKTMAQVTNPDGSCVTLAGTGTRTSTSHFVYDKSGNNGMVIHYSGGDYCDELRDYDLTVNIICDMKVNSITNVVVDETHTCFKRVTFSHKSGCKID